MCLLLRCTYRRMTSLLLSLLDITTDGVKGKRSDEICTGYRHTVKRLIPAHFEVKKGCRRKRDGAAASLADFSRTTTTTPPPPPPPRLVRSTRVSSARTSLADGRTSRTLATLSSSSRLRMCFCVSLFSGVCVWLCFVTRSDFRVYCIYGKQIYIYDYNKNCCSCPKMSSPCRRDKLTEQTSFIR